MDVGGRGCCSTVVTLYPHSVRMSLHAGTAAYNINSTRVIYGSEGFVEAHSALDGHSGACTAPTPPHLSAFILVTSKTRSKGQFTLTQSHRESDFFMFAALTCECTIEIAKSERSVCTFVLCE